MKKTLLAITAACLLAGCGRGSKVEVHASVPTDTHKGGIHFIYRQGTVEINFFDEGFDGTLDLVTTVSSDNKDYQLLRGALGFGRYDSMYVRVREMAARGE